MITVSTDLEKLLQTPDDVIAMQLVSRVVVFAMTHSIDPLALSNAMRSVFTDASYTEEKARALAEAGKHWQI